MKRALEKLKSGRLSLGNIVLSWRIERPPPKNDGTFNRSLFAPPYRLHLGPGPNWSKPDNHWINVDVDPARGDIVVNFSHFNGFPLEDRSVECIYGSHVFEHMSIWVTDRVFSECHRVLRGNGILRLVLPDVERSIREYAAGNAEFQLFDRRRKRAKEQYGLDYTLFDCLREDFLSRSGQSPLLGEHALAHQNAWDFESIERDLKQAGFSKVIKMRFQETSAECFKFEGTYPSEATEDYRSLYVEAIK